MPKRGKSIKDIIDSPEPVFRLRDILQVIIGASILAVPVGFTEETWGLGENLPILNTLGLLALSLIFISTFTYYHYHHHKHTQKEHKKTLVKRIVLTYLFSFIVVSIILMLIERAPWLSAFLVALKRVIIVTFPASMSAAVADTIK